MCISPVGCACAAKGDEPEAADDPWRTTIRVGCISPVGCASAAKGDEPEAAVEE